METKSVLLIEKVRNSITIVPIEKLLIEKIILSLPNPYGF